ncbi:methylglutaconyl-CoA hydratase [Rhodoblastus acidophilus]|uniref:enoyl-CoA hydratase/isomerase family protein n=1 Tax=Rhodoblastus acidophilus TaxID=1074 RepID=UPI00222474FE|nr:enoyl-CoA hydratase/isomerase family protein [Rhodoblastus acidophilus]MCW2286553.1 methylglutaconyl-CoA hydratase [Rhodoblastus acidophilus]MCW2335402.1 methylglutaconyl-CoA hydratase [Rhodoblastus acidophilus]
MFELLEIVREGKVATVWMNRPERHNAFNAQLIAELTQAFEKIGADKSVCTMVLAGRGKSFSAGADLAWMKALGDAGFDDNLADARKLAAMLRTLADMPKPTLARVHGAALGGGMGLAAACDICVAASGATFATSEVRFGLIPSAIGPYVLRAIGPRHASRYFLTAESIPAWKAAEIGLVHEVAEAEALDICVKAQLDLLLQGGPRAQAEAKRLIRDIAGKAADDSIIEETAQRIARLRGGDEAREGLSAFLDKRPPKWSA